MDLNQVAAPASDRITGVGPVDEDTDRSMLAQAIAEHETNDDVDAGLSSITCRDDRTPSGWILDELSAHAYVRDAAAPAPPSTATAGGSMAAIPIRRLSAS